MADMKETYTLMFTDYPDIVNLVQMRKMLGGISNTLAYRMLREKKIKSKKVSLLDISKIDEFFELGYRTTKNFLEKNKEKIKNNRK